MISQLELGKMGEKKPEKRVNGIFWILLINIGIYVADHIFQVREIKALYLYHNFPVWYQFVTSTFCHANWNHLSSNLFFLYIFGKLVEEEEGSFGVWLSYILTGAGANLVSWLVLPRNAVSVGASGAVFGLFAISVLVKLSFDWRKILEVLILGQFVIERVMEAAQASTSFASSSSALQNVNHIAHLSGALVGATLVLSSGLIWGIGDLVAQAVTRATAAKKKYLFYSDDDRDLRINWRRLVTTSLYGMAFVGPIGHFWYEGLDRFLMNRLQYPPKSMRFVATKVAIDEILFGPVDLFLFFTYMGFASGKNVTQVTDELKRDFLPALIVEGGTWPVVQVINFRFVPVRYQLLYVNLFCLLDSCFLSWLEQQQDAPWKQWFRSLFFEKPKRRDG
ncbi:hypothetical protein E3N88_15881 [Mikania micrantha]|uniref:Peptidase S54 rhomboid domain-containing protein n=1 Tax=Mikania micrantha TaxID=192012 RepID=A0A5N6NYI3_9ASTR|nr:hypothetical protein E3N88_15881 [Mikania micrantha]